MTLSPTMAPLGQFKRWINWTLEPDPKRPEKPRKVPRAPITGHICGATDQSAWCTYEVAHAAAVARGHGLGYAFHEGDNLFFLDIDNCVDETTGQWSQIAQNLMEIWKGHAAIEVSQSGKGLHIVGYASSIPPHGCKNVLQSLELYHTGRFMAFTDRNSVGTIGADLSPTLAGVIAAFFPKTASSSDVVDWCDEGDGAEPDDTKLLDIMLRSGLKTAAATFKADHVPFKALWNDEAETLAKAFPCQNSYDPYDRSHADSALASHLVYWCGGNLERVRSFMLKSGLVRDKWMDRPDYLETTIIKAAAIVRNRAEPRQEGPTTVGNEANLLDGDISEDVIAEAFKVKYAGKMKYDHQRGKWFNYDEHEHWVQDNRKGAFHRVRLGCREVGFGKRWLGKASTAEGVEKLIRADPAFAVTADVWDNDPMLLGVPGGTIDLRTSQHRPASPNDMITKKTSVAPAPGAPVLWLRVLADLFPGDPDLVAFLKRFFGYVLTGSVEAHALVFFLGPGGNGKSTVLNVLAKMLADYAVTATMETFMATNQDRHTTDLAMLQGARLVTASETEGGRFWAEARLKAMTGGDRITARLMRQDNFTYMPQFKLVIAGNHPPRLRNPDEAMRRRLFIVPFLVKPSKPDPKLEQKLSQELPQILAWCIEGCLEWQRDGLNPPASVKLASQEYFETQDIFGQWLAEVLANAL